LELSVKSVLFGRGSATFVPFKFRTQDAANLFEKLGAKQS